jgi:hypothetical protein
MERTTALCYHCQTQYGCSLCKVLLCRTPITKVTQDGVHHSNSCFNLWHMKINIEAEWKKFMKTKSNKKQQNKRDTRSTRDKTMRSPLVPQKRKRSTSTSVLTEVRKKKPRNSTSSEESADSESTSEESTPSPPLVAVGNRRSLP